MRRFIRLGPLGGTNRVRADLVAALSSQEYGGAARVLERLGADRERLRSRLAEAFGPQGLEPASVTDA